MVWLTPRKRPLTPVHVLEWWDHQPVPTCSDRETRFPSCPQMGAFAVGLLLVAVASCEVANAATQQVKGAGNPQQVLGGRKLLQMAVFTNPTVSSGGVKYPLCSCMRDHTSSEDDAYECTNNKAAALAWYWAEGRDNQLVFEPTTKVTGTINTEPVQCYDGETLRCTAAFTGLQMAVNKPRCTPNPNGQGVSCVGRHK